MWEAYITYENGEEHHCQDDNIDELWKEALALRKYEDEQFTIRVNAVDPTPDY